MPIPEMLSGRAKVSDPQPAYCCVCLASAGPDMRFVNFGARIEVGAVVDPISGGLLARLDKVEICEACVKDAAETLEFRPTLHRTHLEDVRMSRAEMRRWQGVATALLAAVNAFWSNELEQTAPEMLSEIRALLRAETAA